MVVVVVKSNRSLTGTPSKLLMSLESRQGGRGGPHTPVVDDQLEMQMYEYGKTHTHSETSTQLLCVCVCVCPCWIVFYLYIPSWAHLLSRCLIIDKTGERILLILFILDDICQCCRGGTWRRRESCRSTCRIIAISLASMQMCATKA